MYKAKWREKGALLVNWEEYKNMIFLHINELPTYNLWEELSGSC